MTIADEVEYRVDADVRKVTCGNCARVATGKKTTP